MFYLEELQLKMKNLKKIIENSFWQLLAVYVVLVILISFGLLQRYTIHFEVFALILGIFGLFLATQQKAKIPTLFVAVSLVIE